MTFILVSQHPIVHCAFIGMIIWYYAGDPDKDYNSFDGEGGAESQIPLAFDYMIPLHLGCLIFHFWQRFYEIDRSGKKKDDEDAKK